MVEELIKGLDDIVRDANIWTSAIDQLSSYSHWSYHVRLQNTLGKQEATIGEGLVNEPMLICQKSTRNASIKACKPIKNWTDIICSPGGCQESDDSD